MTKKKTEDVKVEPGESKVVDGMKVTNTSATALHVGELPKVGSECAEPDCSVAVWHGAHVGTPPPSGKAEAALSDWCKDGYAIAEQEKPTTASEDTAEQHAAGYLNKAKQLLAGVGHFETNAACAKIDEALALLAACAASDEP